MPWLSDKTLQRLRAAAQAPDLSATKYRLLEKLSRGGMGTIYLAEDEQLNRKVALKVMHLAEGAGGQAARMRREARVIARLEHPGIVPVHDVGELPDGRIFYVMKFVQGRRLDQYAAARPPLPERLRVFQKICEAVAFAHANGVIHRDLKPENIMVGAFGEVLVMDWGLAKIVVAGAENEKPKASTEDQGAGMVNGGAKSDDRSSMLEHQYSIRNHAGALPQTQHGTVMGTPAYMAPEQQRGEIDQIDERSDVYALGAILKFLLSDTPPDNGSAPASGKIPKHLAAIYARAMFPEKAGRYAGAQALAQDVERFLNGLAVSSYKENLLEAAWRGLKKYQFMVLLVLIYLLVRILLFFWLRP